MPRWPFALFVSLFAAHPALSQEVIGGYRGVSLFDTPRLAAQERLIAKLGASGDAVRAQSLMEALTRRYPEASRPWFGIARLALQLGETDKAADALAEAAARGADLTSALSSGPFVVLSDHPVLQDLDVDRAPDIPAPDPQLVKSARAPVDADHCGWAPAEARIKCSYQFAPAMKRLPLFGDGRFKSERLETLVRRGFAAGNVGDIYDNLDGAHSRLRRKAPTQVTYAIYGPAAQKAKLHYGTNEHVLFDAITFGNSSTALTGKHWRSQPRAALTLPDGPARLWQLYRANHIYVFPEHKDHDPISAKGQGDVFPANTPYYFVSQGSSGSDLALVRAIQMTLAALPTKVKAKLRDANLIAPTVQQIIRRAAPWIERDEDYLSGRAHPTAFVGAPPADRLIDLAQALTLDALPPLATFAITSADGGGGALAPEALFATPAAAALQWRSPNGERKIRLLASGEDANDRPLTFHWRLLRGDPAKVQIRPLDGDGREVEITARWHDETRTAGEDGVLSNRIDIGLFAHNGAHYSAPAFFSISAPIHEERTYAASGQLLRADYARRKDRYRDPRIWPLKPWVDTFDYDENGRLTGWTRSQKGAEDRRYTANGLLALELDDLDRPVLAEQVAYSPTPTNGDLIFREARTGRLFDIEYQGDGDRIGRPVSR